MRPDPAPRMKKQIETRPADRPRAAKAYSLRDPQGPSAATNAPDEDSSVVMPHAVAVALLPPAIHHIAAVHGIRVLSIKGAVLAAQGLRSRRRPSDVDVLVDPAMFEDLVAILRSTGWRDRDGKVLVPLPRDGTVLAPHARTLEHPRWPCQLDLHRYYPGFLRPAQDVFDRLWERRHTAQLAHAECDVPSPADHWLLAALHVLRSGDEPQLRELETAASAVLRGRERDLLTRAEELGAVGPLQEPLTRILGVSPVVPDSDVELLAEWTRRIHDPGNLPDAFLEQFREASGATRIRLAFRQAWPPPRSARAFHDVGDGPLGLFRFYLARLALAPVKMSAYLRLHRRAHDKEGR